MSHKVLPDAMRAMRAVVAVVAAICRAAAGLVARLDAGAGSRLFRAYIALLRACVAAVHE